MSTHADLALSPPARPVAGALARALDRPAAATLALIALATLARLLAGGAIGLSVDESYAVSVARRLDLSYFDHPPLSFWLPTLMARLTGSEAPIVLRLPFIALFAGTSWLVFRLTARLFGQRAGVLAVLLLSVSPVFTFSTGGWVLPDGPLMFCMLAAALCLSHVLLPGDSASAGNVAGAGSPAASAGDVASSGSRAASAGRAALAGSPASASVLARQKAWRWWLGAGAFTGLAMLSKYHGVFVAFGAFLFILTRPDARRWLARPEPYAAVLLALAIFSPALLWNLQHDWVSLRFQGGRGAPAPGIHLLDLLRSLGGQMAYLLPWIWIPAAWLLVKALLRGPGDARRWLLACLAVGPVVFFTLPALGGRPGLPHWEAPGWLFTFPLLGASADALLARSPGRARAWLGGSVAGYALVWLLGVSWMATGWVGAVFPSLLRRSDPSWEVVTWSDLAPALAARALPAPGGFVAATRWMGAGKASYALGGRIPVVCLCDHPHHFHFLDPQEHFLGRDAVLVMPPDAEPEKVVPLLAHFRSVQSLGSVTVHRRGHPEFQLPIYLARGFIAPVKEDLAKY